MTEQEFKELLEIGHERRGVEFKAGGSAKENKQLVCKIVRAIIGMANNRDGGLVIIGVEEGDDGKPIPSGISDADLPTWNYDDLTDLLAKYCDPFVEVDLEEQLYEGKKFLNIYVREFESIPVLCKRDFPEVLRSGACYVRTRKKPETSEIPTQTEMRELLDIAVEKGVRKFATQVRAAGMVFSGSPLPTDDELFEQQIADVIGEEN